MELYLLTAILFATQLGDWYTTRVIINKGGYEQNPLMQKLFFEFGMDEILIIKTIAATAIGYWIGTQVIWVLAALVVFYIGILIHNWKSL